MTEIGGGRLALFFEGSRELKMTTSLGGRAWTSPTVAVSYKNTSCSPANPTPYYDSDTSTLYLAYRCPSTTDNFYTARIEYVKSTDNGVSWSKPYTVALSTVHSQEEYGGMWEPTIYRIEGKLRIYYSCSTLKEGTGQVVINPGTEHERIDDTFPYVPSKSYQNIVMHELDEESGAWSGGVGVYRGEDHLPYKPVGTKYHCRDGMQSITRLSDGTYVMAVETSKYNVANSYGMTRYPMVVDISFSRDGVSFTDPITVGVPKKAKYKCAAPWVVTLPDGRIAISYQTDDYLESQKSDGKNYGQLKVIISKSAVTYEDAGRITAEDFEGFYPFESLNNEVTYNYWNALYVSGTKLYAMGNISTNDKTHTPARGTMLAVFDVGEAKIPDKDSTDTAAATTENSTISPDTADGTTAAAAASSPAEKKTYLGAVIAAVGAVAVAASAIAVFIIKRRK